MKKAWRDPFKGVPPQPGTLAIEGDWEKFTGDMKKLFKQTETKEPKASAPASRVPASSV
jgi:hypothetical protein